MTSRQLNFPLVLILILGFIARLVFFVSILRQGGEAGFYAPVNQDAGEYRLLAQNLMQGHFSLSATAPFFPERFRTPGYPVFVMLASLFNKSVAVAIAAQNIIFLAFIALFFLFVEKQFGRVGAIFSSAILALDPAVVYWNNQLTSETIFTVVLAVAAFYLFKLFQSKKITDSVWSALWLVIAIYVRPIALYLPVIWLALMLVFVLKEKFNWRAAVAMLAIFILVWNVGVGWWRWRNWHFFQTPIFSTSTSIGFGKYLIAMKELRHEPLDTLPTDDLLARLDLRRQETFRYIAAHPLLFLKIHLASLAPFLIGDGYQNAIGSVYPSVKDNVLVNDWSGDPGELLVFLKNNLRLSNAIFIVGKMVWSAITLLALFGVWSMIKQGGRGQRLMMLLAALAIIYYFALASGIGSYSRFRFPVNPLILLLAGGGIQWLSNKKYQNKFI